MNRPKEVSAKQPQKDFGVLKNDVKWQCKCAWINIWKGVDILYSECCSFENACVIKDLISCHFRSALDELSRCKLFGMSGNACWVESGQPSLFWLSGVSGLSWRKVFPWGLALFPDYTFNFCHVEWGMCQLLMSPHRSSRVSGKGDLRDFKLWLYSCPQGTGDIFGNDVIYQWRHMIWDQPL